MKFLSAQWTHGLQKKTCPTRSSQWRAGRAEKPPKRPGGDPPRNSCCTLGKLWPNAPPVVRAQVFAGDDTVRNAFNLGAVFGGDFPARFPHGWRRCTNADSLSKRLDASADPEGKIQGLRINWFCGPHERECMALTNQMQVGGPIEAVNTIAERLATARKGAGMSQAELAAKVGVSPGTIGNIEAGTRDAPRHIVEIAAALGVSPLWLKNGTGLMRPQHRGEAHNMSLSATTMPLQRVAWEQLMAADLSKPFELVVIDDSLGPDLYPGCVVRLDPNKAPQAGRPVLVRDSVGRHYLRDYQVAGSGRWQAVARQRGYAPLDSEADGLRVVAVMKGFDWP